jgi:GH24 family phage-related lysozyme (muramidase)
MVPTLQEQFYPKKVEEMTMRFKIGRITVGYGETIPRVNTIGTDKFYFEPSVEVIGDEELTKEQLDETLGELYEQIHTMVKSKVRAKIQQGKAK